MILADKIIHLRKRNGWSQEDLAEKMNVSRQAVSKWEAAQTTPDLGKILQLSSLFGVTTDYLLKDEYEDEEFTSGSDEMPIRKITPEQANDYLDSRVEASVAIAGATFLCIISVIPLLLFTSLSELIGFPFASNLAVGVGMVTLFAFIAIAVAIFIWVGFKNAPYEFLEKEPFEAEYSVIDLVKERQKSYHPTYAKCNMIGTVLCILSPLPLVCAALAGNEFLIIVMVCVLLFLVATGVTLFIIAGVRWASMQRILKEGEFSHKGKIQESIEGAYWLIATAIYLGWSFLSNDWHITWVIWPIAGVLFGMIEFICNLVMNKNK